MNGVTLEKSCEGLNEENRLECMIHAWRSLRCNSESAFLDKSMPAHTVREISSWAHKLNVQAYTHLTFH